MLDYVGHASKGREFRQETISGVLCLVPVTATAGTAIKLGAAQQTQLIALATAAAVSVQLWTR